MSSTVADLEQQLDDARGALAAAEGTIRSLRAAAELADDTAEIELSHVRTDLVTEQARSQQLWDYVEATAPVLTDLADLLAEIAPRGVADERLGGLVFRLSAALGLLST